MTGNSAFELVDEQGWRAGLKNMLRAEFNRWWKTRTWWVQSLVWIGVVDLILITVISAANAADELVMPIQELVMLYGVFGGMFTAVGVVISMQGAIVGEKISGTAAWVLSKPISRHAFVLAKLLANAFGVVITAMLIPGLGAYLIITLGTGESLSLLNFMGGMGILYLFVFYWLAFTLMLGAFFNARGPVIGIPLAFILGQQFILGVIMSISPKMADFFPFSLVMPPQETMMNSVVGHVIMGTPPPSWMPVYSSAIAIILFVVIGIWRFRREEF
ncbi:MAG: ABC transporter permease [Anaerolineales bacterium]|nr:ABC transporter permease [Anaerolineales bacterium]